MSWRPRAVYFPNFATAEQCESIIDVAKDGLKPSTLALRQGETEENTKGIRTRYCVCVCVCKILNSLASLWTGQSRIANFTLSLIGWRWMINYISLWKTRQMYELLKSEVTRKNLILERLRWQNCIKCKESLKAAQVERLLACPKFMIYSDQDYESDWEYQYLRN